LLNTMTIQTTRQTIAQVLQVFSTDNLTQNAINLFEILGYNTERQVPQIHRNVQFADDLITTKRWVPICSFFSRPINRTLLPGYLKNKWNG